MIDTSKISSFKEASIYYNEPEVVLKKDETDTNHFTMDVKNLLSSSLDINNNKSRQAFK